MKKFAFSLQYLLDAHIAKEQAAEHALQRAMVALRETEAEMAAFEEAYAAQAEALGRMHGPVNRADYAVRMRSIDFIRRDIEQLKDVRAQRDAEVERCRTALREEMTARRVLEKLRDRERGEWAEALQAEDQKMMDEMAVVRWSRRER